jgi:hypothetical protein
MGLINETVVLLGFLGVFGIVFVFFLSPLFTATHFTGNIFTYLIEGTAGLFHSIGEWISCGIFGVGCP